MFANTFIDTPLMFVGVVLLSAMGAILYVVIVVIERLVMPWHVTEEEEVIMSTA
jgi:NitT/TauT family transport system permease protein